MKKIVLVILLILALSSSTLIFAGIVQAKPMKRWQIEDGGGSYSFSRGTIRMWGNVGSQWIILYKAYAPKSNFQVSLKVKANVLQGFAIMLRGSLPFAGSTDGVNFEFGARDGGSFTLARYASGWTWNVFLTGVQQDVWYTMKLTVYKNSYRIVAQVFSDRGALLGSYTASDMSNFAFSDIKYVGFGVLESGGDFAVKRISVSKAR